PAPTTRAALTAAPQPAQDPTAPMTPAVPAAPGSPLEAGDADCPAIPAGADPARWRCEVHVGAPLLTVGAVEGLVLAPMTITFAGGPLPDGTKGQVFGALRSAAHRPGCPADCSGFRRRWARPPGPTPAARSAGSPSTQCGGRSDFCTGQLSLRLVLRGPLLPDSCAIGGSVPIDLALRRTAPAVRESEEPPLIRYSMEDGGFAAPVVGRCGPLGHLLDRRLGLPAADGNLLRLDAAYTFRTYDRLR
uniref:hypothetical protein n=1 Tax=Kitasatospora sp. MBT63 TaxID=1444768 RepID=UPI0034CE44B8